MTTTTAPTSSPLATFDVYEDDDRPDGIPVTAWRHVQSAAATAKALGSIGASTEDPTTGDRYVIRFRTKVSDDAWRIRSTTPITDVWREDDPQPAPGGTMPDATPSADPLAPENRPRVRVEARHLTDGMRIAVVEDVKLDPPVLIEQVIRTEEYGLPIVKCAVWHGTWMFGLEFTEDDQVEVVWDLRGRTSDLPPAPARDGMVRVHGNWYPKAEAPSWAPNGYPFARP